MNCTCIGGGTGKGNSRDRGPEVDGVCSTEDSMASKDGVWVKVGSTGKGPLLYCVPC